jgi:hypothetical protein
VRKFSGGKNGAAPGSEILRGYAIAQVCVYVRRGDVLGQAAIIDVLEKPLAGQILRCFDDLGDAAVFNRKSPAFPRLALEDKAQLFALDHDVLVQQGR